MSLDVYLTIPVARPAAPRQAIFVREVGQMREISRPEWDMLNPGVEPVTVLVDGEVSPITQVFTANITHNLGPMAKQAGLYHQLWRPDELDMLKASKLVLPLHNGLRRLQGAPATFRRLNPSNGWGTYEGLVGFVAAYLDACRAHPDADVSVCR